MILTDREIRIGIDQKLVKLEPVPQPEAFSSTSVDLTLHDRARRFKQATRGNRQQDVDPGAQGFKFNEVIDLLTESVSLDPQFRLVPGRLLLAWTRERLELPLTSRLAARVEGKSSLARLGVGIHITAPTIHAGFDGQIQLEIVNHGPAGVLLRPGMRICQLILETTLGTPETGYAGMFAGQQAN